MSQTFGTMLICHTHHIPMKRMNICGFTIPYCRLCTKPKGKQHFVDRKTADKLHYKEKIQKLINKTYWSKYGAKIQARKPSGIREQEEIHKRNMGLTSATDRLKFRKE